jgi:NADPH-dependent F420 reductase
VIGIVGGSGDFGQGLAERLRRAGNEVVIGSRTPRGDFVSNPEACRASEIVFLSVPPGGVEATARELAADLAGRVLVSVAAPIVFRNGRPGAAPGERSLAETAQEAAPAARVVAGFHTVSAKALADPDLTLDEDVLLCGDDAGAKEVVAGLVRDAGFDPVDAGGAERTGDVEAFARLVINLAYAQGRGPFVYRFEPR